MNATHTLISDLDLSLFSSKTNLCIAMLRSGQGFTFYQYLKNEQKDENFC